MALALQPKLVRERDRVNAAVWQINPRTGFLEARAGLSWTGVREYRTPTGVIRVLRRPEQVCSPGHLRTLRLLPCTDGHPAGDVDVSPVNEAELRVGSTGAAPTIETINGYPRPVDAVSVSRPSTMARMVDASTWIELCDRWPALAQMPRSDGEPATGNSLGYNALWWGPHVEGEIKSERDDGSLIGEWMGPHGAELYDVEHIIDPDCEIVQKLVRDAGFDASALGGNHNAVALQCLGGRGGAQTELMRIVDSRDVPLTFDLQRAATRVSVQVPAQAPAPASTLERDRLSQSDAPKAVPDRASEDVDSRYKNTKPAGAASRDGARRMNIQSLEFGLGRDNFAKLIKTGVLAALADKGRTIPQARIIPVTDAPDMAAIAAGLEEMRSMIGDLIEMCGESMGEAEAAGEAVEDAKAMKARCEDLTAQIAAKQEELAAMQAKLDAEKKAGGEAAASRDALLAEVEPLRAAELTRLRDAAIKLGCDEAQVKATTDAAMVRRVIATAKLGEKYSARDGEGEKAVYRVHDSNVASAVEGLLVGIAQPQSEQDAAPARDFAAPFRVVPPLTPHQPAPTAATSERDENDNTPIDPLLAGLRASGG